MKVIKKKKWGNVGKKKNVKQQLMANNKRQKMGDGYMWVLGVAFILSHRQGGKNTTGLITSKQDVRR